MKSIFWIHDKVTGRIYFLGLCRVFQSDGGGEYLSHKFKLFLLDKDMLHKKSCHHTPEQNGLAE